MNRPMFTTAGGDWDWYLKSEVDAYLDKLFADAVRVYGRDLGSGPVIWDSKEELDSDTHQAYLFQIEEIKPTICEHEIINYTVGTTQWLKSRGLEYCTAECIKCLKKLRAKWEVADE